MKGIEYTGLASIDGPIIIVDGIKDAAYDELVRIKDDAGIERYGRVLEVSETAAAIQVLGSTQGIPLENTKVSFLGHSFETGVSEDLLGRVFTGLGEPRDGLPKPFIKTRLSVNGMPINPYSRIYPRDFIQTGISSIDGLNTLIRGQKLPIFSGSGMSHNQIAAQIVRQAKLKTQEEFIIVFAAMGVKFDVARYFLDTFQDSGAMSRVVMYLSLADDPSIERLITPRAALTAAEYFAFEKGMHVLVILTDMTNYCEAVREVSTVRGEIPSRKGYPGYLYSDLASLYERAGRIKTSQGSITQIPILSMPNDDITHPIPDLTGYITEGQIVLDRSMHQRSIYPPVAGLPSLSRLMKDGIGEGMTRDDHPRIASQLFAAYSHVKEVRSLASVIGEEELSDLDKLYIKFGEEFEQKFIHQSFTENREIEQTLEIGWKTVSILPADELYRVKEEDIKKYYGRGK